MKIPTLYSSLQELYLDVSIYGKIVSARPRNKDELREVLFEEFKLSHPLPSLELQRYELSDLVSNDFDIGDEELSLSENESLIDITDEGVTLDIPESYKEVPDDIRVLYNYENRVTDELREKYLSYGIEEFEGDASILGTVTPNEDSVLTDEEVEQLENGGISEEPEYEEEQGLEFEFNSDDSEDEYEEEYEEEVDDSDEYEEEYEEEVDDSDSYEEEYEEEIEDSDEYEEEYEEDTDSYEEESDDYEEEVDDSDEYEEEYEEESDDIDSYEEPSNEGILDEEDMFEEPEEQASVSSDNKFLSSDNFSERASPPKKEDIAVEEPSIDEVPKDLRQFLRKYPRCDIKFALKYFSKKEIDKAILIGKIVRRGNKLHI